MAALKENTKNILMYLQDNDGKDLTAADVAEALGLEKRSVDGSFTSFQKKEWGVREPAEVENPDGSHTKVKYLRLTELGLSIDPENPPEK